MSAQERAQLEERARIEGYKAAMAVVRRMAQERRSPQFYVAHDWLKRQGEVRWSGFDEVEAL